MTGITAVFFDLGGTLLVMRRDRIFREVLMEQGFETSVENVHSAYMQVEPGWLSDYGVAMSPEQTVEAYWDLNKRIFLKIFPDEGEDEADRVSMLSRDRWPEIEKSVPLELYPEVMPLLTRLLNDGLKAALVSNAPSDTMEVIERLGLTKYLNPVIISGIVGYAKPHPEIFRIALRQAGVEPNQAIHVGDLYEADVAGARNAGITGILIDRDGIETKHDCPRIASLDEVYRYI